MNYCKLTLLIVIAVIGLYGCGGAEDRKSAYLEKARLSIEAGDFDKARIELKNVLQIDPKDAQAYFQLGNVFEQKKERMKAFRNFSKAAELDPENFEVQAKIGRYHLVLGGDVDKAIEIRDLILSKDKDNVSGMLLTATILVKQNDIASAKKISQDIFSKEPGYVENAAFLSSLYLIEKEYENSIDVLTACIKQNPNNRDLKNTLANTYFRVGKHDQAEKEYKEILERNPDVFSNYSKLAMFYVQIDKKDKAEAVLRNAIEVNEEDLQRKNVLVEFIQQTKGNQAAIEELKTLIAVNPRIGDLRLALGKIYFDENKLDDAEKIFKSAISDFSEDSIGVKSRVYLGYLYMKKHNIDSATSVINEASMISPNDTEVNFFKAKLLLTKKDYEGAIISLRSVIKDDPEDVEAYFLLSAAYRGAGEEQQAAEIINQAYENNRNNTKMLLELARYYSKIKDNAKLEKVVDNYLAIDAENYEVLSFKSSLLNKRKMFSEAKQYASSMVQLYPDRANGYLESVPYILDDKGENEVIALLEEGYKKVKNNARILELLVSFQISLKNYEAAMKIVQSAMNEKGKTAELYMLLAGIKIASGNIDNAKTSLNNAMSIRPDWDEPYLLLAHLYTTNKQNKKAIEVLRQGIAELKGDLKLSFGLAKIYESLGDYNEAISVYEKAYEKYTGNVILINNLATLLSEHHNDEKSMKRAKELADKLKSVDQAVTLDTVGWVYYKIGNYADAVNVLKTVVEKSPDTAVFNYHLGMALYKTGDETAAKTYLTNALANNSSFPGKDNAEAHLKKLQ